MPIHIAKTREAAVEAARMLIEHDRSFVCACSGGEFFLCTAPKDGEGREDIQFESDSPTPPSS